MDDIIEELKMIGFAFLLLFLLVGVGTTVFAETEQPSSVWEECLEEGYEDVFILDECKFIEIGRNKDEIRNI